MTGMLETERRRLGRSELTVPRVALGSSPASIGLDVLVVVIGPTPALRTSTEVVGLNVHAATVVACVVDAESGEVACVVEAEFGEMTGLTLDPGVGRGEPLSLAPRRPSP
jgi:hypothetical protein